MTVCGGESKPPSWRKDSYPSAIRENPGKPTMRIFITGASGFIGSQLVPLLIEHGHKLLLLSRQPPKLAASTDDQGRWLQGDLESPRDWWDPLARFAPQVIIHLAWEGLPDYSFGVSRKNFDYARRLFESAAETGCEVILAAGTGWEYRQKTGRVTEESPLGARDPFVALKNAIHFYGAAVARHYGIQFYWPRLFFVYGPGQRRTSLIPHIIDALMRGERAKIRTPENRHDFIYAGDVALAIRALIEARPSRTVYNVGSGRSTAVADILAMTQAQLALPGFRNDSIPNHLQTGEDLVADITRITGDTGWRPSVQLEEGIHQTIRRHQKSR
jgi:UDP-glucose 4-epimerase